MTAKRRPETYWGHARLTRPARAQRIHFFHDEQDRAACLPYIRPDRAAYMMRSKTPPPSAVVVLCERCVQAWQRGAFQVMA